MADLAVDLAKPVLERVRDGIIDHVSYSLFVGDRVGALKSQIEILKAKRRDVEDKIKVDEPAGMVATMEAERWLKSAAQLEKEAESIINEYRNRSCVLCCNFSINLWSNHSISMKAIDSRTKVVDELSSLTNVQITKYPPPPVGQLVSTSSTLGAETGSEIEAKVEVALGFLRNSAEGMLGIWGMGGVGKTTVLNHVNNVLARDPSSGFHRVILVTASRECTVEKVQALMVKALKLPELGDHKNNIFNFLSDKSFVILLDDLWERVDLDQVGVPHLGASVDCLGREKARRLFREKVGEEVINSHPLITSKLADEVADECGGLPIALITIARSMAHKNHVSDWMNAIRDLRESKIPAISRADDPLPLLKISYDYLKYPSLQECLLLCALWPEDADIPIVEIIECWMGHDLVGKFDTVGEAYENGRKIIDSLVKASLLERNVDPFVTGSVRLHDLIRDMALWISRDNGANERRCVVLSGVGPAKALGDQKSRKGAHKVSLTHNFTTRLPSNIQGAHNLNTLMLKGNRLGFKELEVVRNFHQLKYLDLSRNGLDHFPPAVCQLNKLEYLNLSKNLIASLPMELKELTMLKYLLLEANLISEVPSELFSSLRSLEVLKLDSARVGSQRLIVDNMDSLKGRLKGLSINACSQTDLDKLGLLSVPIWDLRRRIAEEEGPASLQLLPRPNRPNDLTWSELDSLAMVHFRSKIEELVIDQCDGSFPNKLFVGYLSNLKEVVWRGVDQNDVIPRLRAVSIWSCDKLQHLSWLINLPLLEMLHVISCENLKQVITKEAEEEKERAGNKPAGVVTLYSLRVLRLFGLPELETICDCTLHLPSLEGLEVTHCERLKKLPFDTPASCRKLKEIRAVKEWWDDTLKMDDDMRTHLQYYCHLC
ncbi:uncharacterized protein A4U43_C06F15080 [Asparagus officinalis]|uniref:NB-ARC domain-containing protein n=1 Tax=Asparagus officinalis TaxID=4686 RepID=A0A5P1EM12_ASPOF|nr:uncharacterized protein A4U43_C06F15080 [Asparagus officinalis]